LSFEKRRRHALHPTGIDTGNGLLPSDQWAIARHALALDFGLIAPTVSPDFAIAKALHSAAIPQGKSPLREQGQDPSLSITIFGFFIACHCGIQPSAPSPQQTSQLIYLIVFAIDYIDIHKNQFCDLISTRQSSEVQKMQKAHAHDRSGRKS